MKQVSARLTESEKEIIDSMGGVTAVLRSKIEERKRSLLEQIDIMEITAWIEGCETGDLKQNHSEHYRELLGAMALQFAMDQLCEHGDQVSDDASFTGLSWQSLFYDGEMIEVIQKAVWERLEQKLPRDNQNKIYFK